MFAFDEGGTTADLLSTRRGDSASLADLARWGRSSRRLTGRVGVVADGARVAELRSALASLPSNGINVVATAWATSDPPGQAAYTDQVEQFVRAGVEEVVMAALVAVQQGWVARASALASPFRYVVSDVDDGVVSESYPATFDGAMAHTALRIPWYSRTHGMTPQQQTCADRWTATASPPVLLASEQEPVFAWCEQVAALSAAMPVVAARGAPLMAALRTVKIASPLTSDIAPLGAGGWGPIEDASLVWRAVCGCWQGDPGFGPGPGPS